MASLPLQAGSCLAVPLELQAAAAPAAARSCLVGPRFLPMDRDTLTSEAPAYAPEGNRHPTAPYIES